jgi:hypothetical protein
MIFLLLCPLDCGEAIGIGQGEIPDNDITASSSSYDDLSQGARGRLDIKYQPPRKSGWCARVNNQNQYLQIDLGKKFVLNNQFTSKATN